MVQDLLSAWRTTARRPGVTLFIASLLGLGLGANAVMFHWVEGTLLSPPPYPNSDRLVRVEEVRGATQTRESLSPPNFFDLRDQNEVFEELTGYWSPEVTFTGDGEAEKLLGATVSHGFFEVLGVAPAIGRDFDESDDAPGTPVTTVLGHGFWMRRFGGDPGVVGSTLSLNGVQTEVIGVAPPGFDYPGGTELWLRLGLPREREDRGDMPYRSFRILNVLGRLRQGTTPEEARANLGTFSERLSEAFPRSNRGTTFELTSLHEMQISPYRSHLLLLFAAVAATLLIVCANVSGLLLARAFERRKELALRATLGASSSRLLRQLVWEGGILAVLGGAVGLVFAYGGSRALSSVSFEGIPAPEETGLRPSLLFFVGAVTGLVCIASVIAPAWSTLRARFSESLRVGGRVRGGTSAESRLRRSLVVGEMALAMLLLLSAALLLQSFDRLRGIETGFKPVDVSFVRVDLPFTKYREHHRRAEWFEVLRNRMGSVPGIESASLSLGVPLDVKAEFFVARSAFAVEGLVADADGAKPEAGLHVVGPEFFELLGVRLLDGRNFDARDHVESDSVVIVNESFAKQYWPDASSPVGRRLTHELMLVPDDVSNDRRVIGVVSDFRYYDLTREPEPAMFIPHSQTPWPQMHLLVRSSLPAEALQAALREQVRALDADVPVENVQALASTMRHSLATPRQRTAIVSVFAAAALVLAAVGLYGLMAFSVSARRQEMGVRLAFGARPRELRHLVWREALVLAGAATAIGLPLGWIATRYVSTLLYGVSASDPTTYVAVAVVMAAVALVASDIPARRASRVDPAVALRGE
jgi:putative ABC transport system permease protein